MLNLYNCSISRGGQSIDARRIAAPDQDQARVKYFNQLCGEGIHHQHYDAIEVYLPDWMDQLNQVLWKIDSPVSGLSEL